MSMFKLKRQRRKMEDVKNNILESPVFEFIEEGWIEWVTGVKTSSVDENDLLLYLIWGLDTLKENEKNVREKYWNLVYSAIYKHLKDRKVEDGDINYLTNLICACTMHCIGLNLAGNYDMQDLFCELNHGFGDKLAGVKWLKDKMTVDSSSTPLKEWVRDYMASDIFLTTSKNIAWDDTKVDNLPDLVRGKCAAFLLQGSCSVFQGIGMPGRIENRTVHRNHPFMPEYVGKLWVVLDFCR